jgi:protoporphyrinogen oxidase
MAGKEVLGYIDGGFGLIIKKLLNKIKVINREIVNIKELEKDFDVVIDTRPIEGVDYIGAVDLVFSSDQSLSEYYWHNINDLKSPFLVMVQHNNLLKNGGYNGKNVYYLGTYVPQDHRYFKISDKKIEKEFFDYLKKIKPEFDKNQVLEKKIFKFKNAQHIVTKNYKVPNYKVNEKLYRLNFAQIYPEDRGINFAVKEAKKLVKLLD